MGFFNKSFRQFRGNPPPIGGAGPPNPFLGAMMRRATGGIAGLANQLGGGLSPNPTNLPRPTDPTSAGQRMAGQPPILGPPPSTYNQSPYGIGMGPGRGPSPFNQNVEGDWQNSPYWQQQAQGAPLNLENLFRSFRS